jgi:hypothetical protein
MRFPLRPVFRIGVSGITQEGARRGVLWPGSVAFDDAGDGPVEMSGVQGIPNVQHSWPEVCL